MQMYVQFLEKLLSYPRHLSKDYKKNLKKISSLHGWIKIFLELTKSDIENSQLKLKRKLKRIQGKCNI